MMSRVFSVRINMISSNCFLLFFASLMENPVICAAAGMLLDNLEKERNGRGSILAMRISVQ